MIVEVIVAPSSTTPPDSRLLVPEPPNTADQRYVGLEAPCTLSRRILTEKNSGQIAYLFEGDFRSGARFMFHFAPGCTAEQSEIFVDFDNLYTRLNGDLGPFLHLSNRVPDARDIVRAVQARFKYGQHNPKFNTPATFCGADTGNCIDINTILVACLRSAGIETAYHAGFYFDQNVPGSQADGMHCWVSTMDEGAKSDWDIAHCLRARLDTPISALNPLGGVRATFSYGRGLAFVGEVSVTPIISHFAQPHWVDSTGAAQEAEVVAVLKRPATDEGIIAKAS
jgi:hypothetical protein